MSNDITPTRRFRRPIRAYVALAIWVLSIVGGLAPPIALSIWEAASPTVTVLRGEAGTFRLATVAPGGYFAPTITTVQTSEGSVAVVGVFTQTRGRALSVERTNKDALRLCSVGGAVTCALLAGDWAGSLRSTAETALAFDFQGHSLDYGHLEAWFMFGLLCFLFSGIAALLMTDFGDDDEGSGESQEPSGEETP